MKLHTKSPYIDLVAVANPAMYAAYGRAPYAQLPPQDLAATSSPLRLQRLQRQASHHAKFMIL